MEMSDTLSDQEFTQLLQEFAEVKNRDKTFATQGGLLFNTLFEIAPELKPMFSFADYDEEEFEIKLKIHGANVFKTIERTLE